MCTPTINTRTIIYLPAINFSATKEKLNAAIESYNKDRKLSEKIRGHHFSTLWRLVEYFAYKIKRDNQEQPLHLRKVYSNSYDRLLHTKKLSRDNLKNWMMVESINTITNRLQRLAEAGLISLTKRGSKKNHLTSVIELNSSFVVLEDLLTKTENTDAKNSLKAKIKADKKALKMLKVEVSQNQQTKVQNSQKTTPLLNTLNSKRNINNKLIDKGAFSEKSENGISSFPHSRSANPLHGTPKRRTFSDSAENYNQKVRGKVKKLNLVDSFANKTDEERLEDYRRAMALRVFKKSLVLWEDRTDVYLGEKRKTMHYVADNYFKTCNTIKKIDEAVEKALWCIKFQENQIKTAKMENREQFVFYPFKYFSQKGTGTLYGIMRFYNKYKQGHTLKGWERAEKKIKKTKPEKNHYKDLIKVRKNVAAFIMGERSMKSYAKHERSVTKKGGTEALALFRELTKNQVIR